MIDNGTIGSIFPNWTIKRLIGSGGYGKVYEMERVEGDAVYRSALKVISIPQDESEIKTKLNEGESRESITAYFEGVTNDLLNENRVMAGLKGNSNIVSYEDHQIIRHENGIGSDIFIRMELLTPFIDYMASNRIDEKTVTRLGIDICKALEICEKKNIIHRDIKPGNIFVSNTGDFKLGDFGIARTIDRTSGGMSKKGTYRYMAPEVYRGEAYGRTVDIYSLGLVMYYLMNGNRTPFLPPAPAQVTYRDEESALMRRMNGEGMMPPVNASSGMVSIILKACAFEPAARYKNAAQMRADLEALMEGRTPAVYRQQPRASAPTIDRSYRPDRRASGKRTGNAAKKQIITAATVAIIIVLIGVPLLLHLTKDPGLDMSSKANEGVKGTSEKAVDMEVTPDEKSLNAFLLQYCQYRETYGDSVDFNCRLTSPSEALQDIFMIFSIVDYDVYPGEASPYSSWEDHVGRMDPLRLLQDDESFYDEEQPDYYIPFDKNKVDWIMINILNYSQEDIDAAVKETGSGNEDSYGFYEYKGKYYYLTSASEVEWKKEWTSANSFEVNIDSITRNGDYYDVKYTLVVRYTGDDPDLGSTEPVSRKHTARMQYKKVDGNYYWSMYESRAE